MPDEIRRRRITESTINDVLIREDSKEFLVKNLENEVGNPSGSTEMQEKSKELLDKINNNKLDVDPIAITFYKENKDKDVDNEVKSSKAIMGLKISPDEVKQGQSLEDYNSLSAIMAEKSLNGSLSLTDRVTRERSAGGFGLSEKDVSKESTVSAVAFEREGEKEAHLFTVARTDVGTDKVKQQPGKKAKGKPKVEQAAQEDNARVVYDPSNIQFSAGQTKEKGRADFNDTYEKLGIEVRAANAQTSGQLRTPITGPSGNPKNQDAYRRSCESGAVLLAFAADGKPGGANEELQK